MKGGGKMITADANGMISLLAGILYKFVKKYAKKAKTAEEVEALAAVAGVLSDMLFKMREN